MEPGQQYWPETRPGTNWPVTSIDPVMYMLQLILFYSNLAPRPRTYNLSLMNIVEVSAGNISPVYVYVYTT